MKKLIALLIALICLFGSAVSESPATPTDLIEEELVEIDDDDWGEISIEFERRVYISIDKEPQFAGDTMILTATLVDFQPEDRYRIYWQYSIDQVTWFDIEGEHEQIFTTIIDYGNCDNWWRVVVHMEEC